MKLQIQTLWMLVFLVGIVISVTVRGFFRAMAAYLLGDDTPKNYGFLSLNPLSHVEANSVLGCAVIVTILSLLSASPTAIYATILIIGIMTGSSISIPVPLNPYKFKNQERSMALIGLAGFVSQLSLSLFLLYTMRFVILLAPFSVNTTSFIFSVLGTFINSALWFAFFYILPIPLPRFNGDGFPIFQYFFPNFAEALENQGFLWIIFLMILIWTPIFDQVIHLFQQGCILFLNFLVLI